VILDEILAHKRREVALRRSERPLHVLEAAIGLSPSETREARPPSGKLLGAQEATSQSSRAAAARGAFAEALRQPGVSVIAEFKRKSPSGGELRPGASAADIARMYLENGAAALSVLTDAAYFGGTDDDLVDARAASGLPVLQKDFVVDTYQVYEARALGADAVLLIVRALSDPELRALLELTHGLQMEALVETHSADEVRRALNAGARVIGVNNRDLDTLQTDVSLAPRLRPLVPAECVFVAESGVSTTEQIARLLEVGADAVLVGENLLRAQDPGEQLRRLVVAGSPRGIHA
jgi:indole-3-glycerol phosphate synthase